MRDKMMVQDQQLHFPKFSYKEDYAFGFYTDTF